MNGRFFVGSAVTSAMAVIFYLSIPAAAQTSQANPPTSGAIGVPLDSAATPRAEDGKPNLSGLWGSRFEMIIRKDAEGRTTGLLYPEPDGSEEKGDDERIAKRKADPNQPPYKPELLEKLHYLDENQNRFDGNLHCLPPGVPRIGPPQQIVQTPQHVVFLYNLGALSNAAGNYYRVVPTDGRPHRTDLEPSFFGDSVGHWEGDTLVVDVVGFNNLTWFGPDGRFHSEAMHVTEHFTRYGNNLKYEVTVEDPNVLTRPWNMTPRVLKLDPTITFTDTLPCFDTDVAHMVGNHHH